MGPGSRGERVEGEREQMSTAEERAASTLVDRYYVGYLRDSLSVLVSAEQQIEASNASHPDVIRAEVVAHKIKGNAALYDLPELGELAEQLETVLKNRATLNEIHAALQVILDAVREITETGRRPVFGASQPPNCAKDSTNSPAPIIELVTPVSKPAPQPSAFANKSMLIVFEDPWFEDFLGTYFGSEANLVFRRSCAEAVQWLASNTPDLIVCESDLPDTPGVSFMKFMRANGALGRVPFLMAFPHGSEFSSISEAVAAGASAILDNKNDVMRLAEQMQELLASDTRRVLIIDDDEPVRELLRNTFERGGFTVETAVDGIDALSRLGTKLPDVIILDRLMPRMNGEATLRELQASINTGAVPVIVLTAMDNAGEASRWLMRGASEFIAKPFDPNEVLERARKLLKSRKGAA